MSNEYLEMVAGDDRTISLTITTGGAPTDLTGATLWFTIQSADGSTALVEKTTASGITIDNAAGGLASVALAAADTASFGDFDLGRALPWEVQLKDSAGVITTVAVGFITVETPIVTATT